MEFGRKVMVKKQIEVKTPHDIFLDDLYAYIKHSYPRIGGLTREMMNMRPQDKSAITTVQIDQNFDYAEMHIDINLIIKTEV